MVGSRLCLDVEDILAVQSLSKSAKDMQDTSHLSMAYLLLTHAAENGIWVVIERKRGIKLSISPNLFPSCQTAYFSHTASIKTQDPVVECNCLQSMSNRYELSVSSSYIPLGHHRTIHG